MSTLSQFAGGVPVTKSLINAYSAAGWSSLVVQRTDIALNATGTSRTVISGATTADTLKSMLSVTGKGCIDLFGFWLVDATSRTIRAKITIDGVVVYDYTSGALANANYGAMFIGMCSYGSVAVPDPVYFNQSLLIEMASSLTETDKFNIGYRYKTF